MVLVYVSEAPSALWCGWRCRRGMDGLSGSNKIFEACVLYVIRAIVSRTPISASSASSHMLYMKSGPCCSCPEGGQGPLFMLYGSGIRHLCGRISRAVNRQLIQSVIGAWIVTSSSPLFTNATGRAVILR